MGTQQRRDLQSNIPALRKIDAMLLVRKIAFAQFEAALDRCHIQYITNYTLGSQDYLDNFKDRNDFWYVKRDACSESEKEEAG